MRHRIVFTAVAVLCVSPLAAMLVAQAQEPAVRGRADFQRAEPPKNAKPAPRGANGRVLLENATVPGGLWTPLFGTSNPILEFEKVPFQPWARALYKDRQGHE